jgi:hypothetical protein
VYVAGTELRRWRHSSKRDCRVSAWPARRHPWPRATNRTRPCAGHR